MCRVCVLQHPAWTRGNLLLLRCYCNDDNEAGLIQKSEDKPQLSCCD